MAKPVFRKYIEVDKHQIWSVKWQNNGQPVVLLHGGLSQTSHWDQNILPAVEDQFHVFGYDRTAHGFTGDRAGSLHFGYQVKEAIAYLETIVKEPAHLIGYSDGGIIALKLRGGPAAHQVFGGGFAPHVGGKAHAADAPVGGHDYGFAKGRGGKAPADGQPGTAFGVISGAHRLPCDERIMETSGPRQAGVMGGVEDAEAPRQKIASGALLYFLAAGQRAATPAAAQLSTAAMKAGSRAVKYCAPWSKLPKALVRVDMRPPRPRLFSNKVTLCPAWRKVRAQVTPAMPTPMMAMCCVFMGSL